MEGGGNWEEMEGGAVRGLLNAGMEGTEGRAVETDEEPMTRELVPWKDSGLDRPENQRTPVTPQTYFSLGHFFYCLHQH